MVKEMVKEARRRDLAAQRRAVKAESKWWHCIYWFTIKCKLDEFLMDSNGHLEVLSMHK
jgi:hypothetical protein